MPLDPITVRAHYFKFNAFLFFTFVMDISPSRHSCQICIIRNWLGFTCKMAQILHMNLNLKELGGFCLIQ